MTVETVFLKAIEVERKVALIYVRIERMFSHVPGIVDFWKDLARDEEHHATMLREVVQSLTSDQLQVACMQSLAEEMVRVEKMVDRCAAQVIANLDDAYELAHEMEFSEVNTVFKALAGEFVRADLRAKFVSAEVIDHQQKLVKFRDQFGDRAWRKSIKAKELTDSK